MTLDVPAVEPGGCGRRSDERLALLVFLVAWLLADRHEDGGGLHRKTWLAFV